MTESYDRNQFVLEMIGLCLFRELKLTKLNLT